MILKFKGKTNEPYQYIKNITFKLKDDSFVRVSRNRTDYTIDNGHFDMIWRGVYAYGRKGNDYTIPSKAFNGAEIIDVTVDDDAPSGYLFLIDSWSAS